MPEPGQYLGLGIFGTHAATPDLGVIQEEQLNVITLMMVTMRRMKMRITRRRMMRMRKGSSSEQTVGCNIVNLRR